MPRRLTVLALCIGSFALGLMIQRYSDTDRIGSQLRLPQAASFADTRSPVADSGGGKLTAVDFNQEPLWAYGFDHRAAPGDTAVPQGPPTRNLRRNEDSVEQTRPRHIEGSDATYSLVDVRDGHNVIDWFPGDHPPMPMVVAHGPVALGTAARGCGSCHLPNGKGRPENAGIAGLPVAYFVRQIEDFRCGRRRSADPRKPNTYTMIHLASAVGADELRVAAVYFGSMQWTPWIRVVETDLVPKTRIEGNLFVPLERPKTQRIAGRIIEMPEDVERSETYRNPRSGFVAYVPIGSIEKGRDLVTTGGNGRTTPCITCHGPDLMGVADIPPIAGRSPSYLVRQLWDIQQGTRNSERAQLMRPVVANLTEEDLVSIAAYVSSRRPIARSSVDRRR